MKRLKSLHLIYKEKNDIIIIENKKMKKER